MSAFLVKNSTLSKLAEWLRYKEDIEGGFFRSFKSDKELAKALYDLNVKALKERYEDYQDFVVPFEYTGEVFLDNDKRRAQAYMSLSCFLYQCNEGRVPETELYKKLEEFRIKMAKEIAFDWAEKQKAIWD